jgi:hypothetical protein
MQNIHYIHVERTQEETASNFCNALYNVHPVCFVAFNPFCSTFQMIITIFLTVTQ